jgi:hypothetical protein
MKNGHIPWYVRLPDGRIVTAKSTASVRHHVESGNIPLNSMARRDMAEEWTSLAWIAEFSDLAGGSRNVATITADTPLPSSLKNVSTPEIHLKSGISSRLDPLRLQTVGIRGLVDELIAAFDSTVSTGKLRVATITCAVGALAVFAIMRVTLLAYPEGAWLAQLLAGIMGLVWLACATALLTRQTHLELSSMRPVYPGEANKNAGAFILRVFLGYVATIGLAVGIIVLLQHLPGWVGDWTRGMNANAGEAIMTATTVLGTLAAVGVFALFLMSFLLPPVLVVEECSLGNAIREWRSILREHRLRVMIYEGMAIALSAVAALPVALPVYLAQHYGPALSSNTLGQALPFALWGMALAPAIAFLAVANLFIYLNLRYEYSPGK